METLYPKKKTCNIFPTRNFFYETTFNFHPVDKVNDFVTTQYTTVIFYSSYLNL